MALNYGEGGTFSVRMDGPFGSVGSSVKVASITAPAADWKGAISPYSQVVNASVSKNSQVDLKLSPEQLEALRDREMAFTACNEGGVVTVYALGDKPESDITFQVAVTEVIAGESSTTVICGGTVTPTMVRSDFAETDPAKASYILNSPSEVIDSAKATADAALPRSGGTMTGALNVLNPTEAAHAANKDYVEKYVASRHAYYEVVLAANGWVGEVAPFTQTIAVEGITETDRPHYGPVYSENAETALLEKENWAVVDDLVTASGSVTFSCFEERPAVDITVQMEVIR